MNRRRLPVYNRSQNTSSVTTVILFGIILGLTFLLFDRSRLPPPAAPQTTATPLPSAAPTLALPSPIPSPQPSEAPQARLLIPAASINALVVDAYLNGESWDVSQLGNNAGHLQGTAWFGTPGNIALAGHVELADGRKAIFAHIDQLSEGDPIILMLAGGEQRYSVTEVKRVPPDDLSILYPTSTDQLTLITCDIGAYNFLENAYQERIVVIAERVTG